jgi:hypothetical protein
MTQTTLKEMFQQIGSSSDVVALKNFMGVPLNIQMKYPVQVCKSGGGRLIPTEEFIRNFIGVIQPSFAPNRILIAILEMGVGLVAKPEDIEAMYVVLQVPGQGPALAEERLVTLG